MAKVIWKWQLTTEGKLDMPINAQVLCVQVQHDTPQLWALVDPDMSLEERQFKIYGTGHPVDENSGEYVGTLQLLHETLVYHVFETTEEG